MSKTKLRSDDVDTLRATWLMATNRAAFHGRLASKLMFSAKDPRGHRRAADQWDALAIAADVVLKERMGFVHD